MSLKLAWFEGEKTHKLFFREIFMSESIYYTKYQARKRPNKNCVIYTLNLLNFK